MVNSFNQRDGFVNLIILIFLLVCISAHSRTHSFPLAMSKTPKSSCSHTPQETGTTFPIGTVLESVLPIPNKASTQKTDKVAPPTTENTQQQFCAMEQPTLESIQVNETHIIWYNTPVNGNQLHPSSSLQDNTTYYAAQLK
ncbi:MAG: hypothetical protein HKM92_15525, partial [Arenibacter sp.]|nr:hypothetical protein [Arenibacter sp.]